VISCRLKLQEIRHLDLGSCDLHQKTLLIASHSSFITPMAADDKIREIDLGHSQEEW